MDHVVLMDRKVCGDHKDPKELATCPGVFVVAMKEGHTSENIVETLELTIRSVRLVRVILLHLCPSILVAI